MTNLNDGASLQQMIEPKHRLQKQYKSLKTWVLTVLVGITLLILSIYLIQEMVSKDSKIQDLPKNPAMSVSIADIKEIYHYLNQKLTTFEGTITTLKNENQALKESINRIKSENNELKGSISKIMNYDQEMTKRITEMESKFMKFENQNTVPNFKETTRGK